MDIPCWTITVAIDGGDIHNIGPIPQLQLIGAQIEMKQDYNYY